MARKWETCVHEAGHVVCAAAFGHKIAGAWVEGDHGRVGYDHPRKLPRKRAAQYMAQRAAVQFAGDEACKLLRVARVPFERDRADFLRELPPGQGPVRAERIARERARRVLAKHKPALLSIARALLEVGTLTGPQILTHTDGTRPPDAPTETRTAA